MKLKPASTALTLGIFVAFIHFVWMMMVFFGFAQLYLNWIFGLHLISNPFEVLPFNFGSATILILFTFVIGYLMGWVFAYIWNRLVKGK